MNSILQAVAMAYEQIAAECGMQRDDTTGRMLSAPFACPDAYIASCCDLSANLDMDWQVIGDNLMRSTVRVGSIEAVLHFGTSDHAPYTHWLSIDMEKRYVH